MKADGNLLLAVVQEFAFISLLAIGGANAVVPEMHREVVDLRHWVTDLQFTELFAISQAAPGPNVMIVALIGQFVAGPLGAVLAMAACAARPRCSPAESPMCSTATAARGGAERLRRGSCPSRSAWSQRPPGSSPAPPIEA